MYTEFKHEYKHNVLWKYVCVCVYVHKCVCMYVYEQMQMLAPWKECYDKPRQCIKKLRHHFAEQGPYSQGYGFSSSHVQI